MHGVARCITRLSDAHFHVFYSVYIYPSIFFFNPELYRLPPSSSKTSAFYNALEVSYEAQI
jgi:hypothetical protein